MIGTDRWTQTDLENNGQLEPTENRGPVLLSIDEVLAIPHPVPLVSGIINSGELGLLYGPPGSGKSFIALDLGLSIAGGSTWAGHRTEVGTVVFVALEGLSGFRRRIPAAVVGAIPPDVTDRFYMIGSNVSLRDTQAAGPLIRTLEQISEQPALVIIDTVARASGGADENSAQEMGNLIAACDAIRSRFGCAILMLHHSRKEGGIYRGSSALGGALDVQMVVTKTVSDGRFFVKLKSEKSKDDEPFDDLNFELQTIELDERDQWNRVRTSLRVVQSSDAGSRFPTWFRGNPEDYVALSTIIAFDAGGEALTTKMLGEQINIVDAAARSQVLRLVTDGYVKRTNSNVARLIAGPAVPTSTIEVAEW